MRVYLICMKTKHGTFHKLVDQETWDWVTTSNWPVQVKYAAIKYPEAIAERYSVVNAIMGLQKNTSFYSSKSTFEIDKAINSPPMVFTDSEGDSPAIEMEDDKIKAIAKLMNTEIADSREYSLI